MAEKTGQPKKRPTNSSPAARELAKRDAAQRKKAREQADAEALQRRVHGVAAELVEKQSEELARSAREAWLRKTGLYLSLTVGFAVAACLGILAGLALALGQDLEITYRWRLMIAIGLSTLAFLSLIAALLLPVYRQVRRVRREELEKAREAAVQAAEELDNAQDLPALLKANRKQMEAYDVLVRGQARTAFRNSQIAMGIGLFVLVVGATTSIAAHETASKIATAGLTAIGGMLSGFIARTFLNTYGQALRQLNFYFQQPLINSYLLTAERLIGRMTKSQQDAALKNVIDKIMGVLVTLPWGGSDPEPLRAPKRTGRARAGPDGSEPEMAASGSEP
jgi:MFS family permease